MRAAEDQRSGVESPIGTSSLSGMTPDFGAPAPSLGQRILSMASAAAALHMQHVAARAFEPAEPRYDAALPSNREPRGHTR